MDIDQRLYQGLLKVLIGTDHFARLYSSMIIKLEVGEIWQISVLLTATKLKRQRINACVRGNLFGSWEWDWHHRWSCLHQTHPVSAHVVVGDTKPQSHRSFVACGFHAQYGTMTIRWSNRQADTVRWLWGSSAKCLWKQSLGMGFFKLSVGSKAKASLEILRTNRRFT